MAGDCGGIPFLRTAGEYFVWSSCLKLITTIKLIWTRNLSKLVLENVEKNQNNQERGLNFQPDYV